jgi:hypothetical protein
LALRRILRRLEKGQTAAEAACRRLLEETLAKVEQAFARQGSGANGEKPALSTGGNSKPDASPAQVRKPAAAGSRNLLPNEWSGWDKLTINERMELLRRNHRPMPGLLSQAQLVEFLRHPPPGRIKLIEK